MANTFPAVTWERHPQSGAGSYSKVVTATCTNDKTTTAVINKRGFSSGAVFNESGGAVTVNYYSRNPATGVNLILKDGAASPSALVQTLADDDCQALPAGVAGVADLVPVLGSGTATLYFVFSG